MKPKINAIVLAAITLIAATCGGHAADKIKVGILKMSALTNLWVAKQSGIFSRNGLDAELIQFRNGNEAINAHRGGSVDFVLSIPGSAMVASERGFDLSLLTQNETAKAKGPDAGSILVLASSPYKSLSDLAGKRIAVSSLHSQMQVSVETALQKAGVDISKVHFMEMPFTAMADTMKAGQVDAIASLDPWTTQLLTTGATRNLSWVYIDALPEQPIGAWYAKKDYIAKNHDIAARFVKSIQESIDYMLADDARARRNVAQFTGLNPKLLEKMPINKWDWHIDRARWQATIEMMRKSGELQHDHTLDEYLSDIARQFVIK
jgi:NitT/TauT family transport system substrate-binding protein